MTTKSKTKEIRSDFHTDAEPDIRVYQCTAHPAEEGYMLLPVVLKMLGNGVAPLVDAFENVGTVNEEGAADLSLENATVKGEPIGRALNGLAAELLSGGVALPKKLLKYTTVTPPGGKEVSAVAHFDVLYQANYGELVQALALVLDVNFGPCLRARFAGGNMSALTGLLSKLNG